MLKAEAILFVGQRKHSVFNYRTPSQQESYFFYYRNDRLKNLHYTVASPISHLPTNIAI